MQKVNYLWITIGVVAAVIAGGFWLALDFSTDAVLKIPATIFMIIGVIVIPIFMEVRRDERRGYYLGLVLGIVGMILLAFPDDGRLRARDGVAPPPPEVQQ